MKLAKRTLALVMCVLMLISCCAFYVNAATASVSMTTTISGQKITSGSEVVWKQYDVTGGNTGHTEEVNILEFNPKDGYIPMVFQNYAGSVSKLSAQYSTAVNKYGYEVAGIINGSFFGVANGTLSGNAISNGRLICAHNDWTSEMVCFDSEGNMNVVSSQLSYSVYINGKEFKDSIRYVNKRFECDGWAAGKFYYYDTSCGTRADSATTGYQILCKKINNSDLTIGGTLFAEVIEVQKDAEMCKFDTVGEESDNFVLYCQSSSEYVSYVKDLKAGDSIAISVNETIAASREIMENANSAIVNVGWLVKDGVDLTETYTGNEVAHNVNTTYARWTAFGTKPDGTYVFFTSDGGSTGTSGRSLNLREVAATMMKLGCNNVIRMDGGGSSSMYTSNLDGNGNPGYIFKTEDRAVADCILIVKKSSAQDPELNTALNAAIASAKSSVETTPNAKLSEYIAEAEAAVKAGIVVESDARRYINNLSGKGELREVINRTSDVDYKEYSESILSEIRKLYEEAIDAYYGDATAKTIASITAELTAKLNSGSYEDLSYGKSYTTSASGRTDIYKDDGIRLTDGSKSNKNAESSTYSGWNTGGKTADVIVDIGAKKEANTFAVYAASHTGWGIQKPTKLTVSISDDNKTFTEVGTCTPESLGTGANSKITLYKFTISLEKAVSGRYVKFSVNGTPHVWLDEVEVGVDNSATIETVGDAVEVHGFNRFIYDSNCFIYTPDHGTLTASGINHKYTLNVILEETDDPTEWKIVSKQKCTGTAADVTLKSNQIMIACHKGETPESKVSDAVLNSYKVGDTLKFYGIDIKNKNIGVAAYVQIKPEEPMKTQGGDVNNDGAIDQFDYILVKRHYFETRLLTDDELTRADINIDGAIDQFDYILIKRHYFGMFVIGG